MIDYKFRAYCDICKAAGPWYAAFKDAESWRSIHFDHKHPDNPMKKTNCRIQREDA